MSNFICSECGTNYIDCGRDGYKTPKEIELEKKVHILNEANMKLENELGHFADLSKQIERLQEQLNEANKLLKYCCANYESSRFGATITEDGEILPKGHVWNYLKKWKV